jgi:hypothetical protein
MKNRTALNIAMGTYFGWIMMEHDFVHSLHLVHEGNV